MEKWKGFMPRARTVFASVILKINKPNIPLIIYGLEFFSIEENADAGEESTILFISYTPI